MKKKYFSFSNIITYLLAVFVMAMFISPNFKASVIQSLMKVGLFSPSIPKNGKAESKNVKAPEVKFMDSNNFPVSTSSMKGEVIFINFWATWCPPCIAEMPSIEALYQQFSHSDQINFLMVDADNDPIKANGFMKKKGFTFPVYYPTDQLPQVYFAGSLPTTVIINKKGEIVYNHQGAADYNSEKMIDFVKKLMAE